MKIRSHELVPPPPQFLPVQVLISVLDWGCAGAALYVLLPASSGLTFPAFFGLYLLALIAGIVSQVPGGLGVFETVFVLMLSPRLPAPTVIGILLAYRGLYYLLPLFSAVLLLGIQELLRKRVFLIRTATQIERWSSIVVPPLLAVASFAGGAVLLAKFTLEGGSRKSLRYTYNRLNREGNTFEVLPVEKVQQVIDDLKGISDTWLAEKKTREKGFSLGFFYKDYLEEFPVAVIRRNGKIVAFTNVWTTASKEELSIDLMRHHPDAPDGVMEFLFIHLMLWGKQSGYRWFNLGMAPLAGLENRPLAPTWSRLASLLYRYGEHFYNFQGLRDYKDKFDPVWAPRYLASPGGMALPRILVDLAALISGGLKGIIAK